MAGSDRGLVREQNEDAVWPPPGVHEHLTGPALLVVADGLGGGPAGEVASRTAVDAVIPLLRGQRAIEGAPLPEALIKAHQALREVVATDPSRAGLATTLVIALVEPGLASIVNVGDSRCYLLRGGVMRQVTADHSWVAEQVKAGRLTVQEATVHPYRNIVTRVVGADAPPHADTYEEALVAGDRLLLCTDGLFGVLGDGEIAAGIAASTPDEVSHRLIELANARGGPDNISFVIGYL